MNSKKLYREDRKDAQGKPQSFDGAVRAVLGELAGPVYEGVRHAARNQLDDILAELESVRKTAYPK